MIDQEKHEIEQIYTWDPITTALIMFNIDFIISIVFLSLTSFLVKCPYWREARRDGCFHRLEHIVARIERDMKYMKYDSLYKHVRFFFFHLGTLYEWNNVKIL